MLFYRAALPLSSRTLNLTAGLIRRHRKSIGSLWRKLNPGHVSRSDYRTSSPVTARPISMRWISLVPSKMVKILASRCQRSTGYSRV